MLFHCQNTKGSRNTNKQLENCLGVLEVGEYGVDDHKKDFWEEQMIMTYLGARNLEAYEKLGVGT